MEEKKTVCRALSRGELPDGFSEIPSECHAFASPFSALETPFTRFSGSKPRTKEEAEIRAVRAKSAVSVFLTPGIYPSSAKISCFSSSICEIISHGAQLYFSQSEIAVPTA